MKSSIKNYADIEEKIRSLGIKIYLLNGESIAVTDFEATFIDSVWVNELTLQEYIEHAGSLEEVKFDGLLTDSDIEQMYGGYLTVLLPENAIFEVEAEVVDATVSLLDLIESKYSTTKTTDKVRSEKTIYAPEIPEGTHIDLGLLCTAYTRLIEEIGYCNKWDGILDPTRIKAASVPEGAFCFGTAGKVNHWIKERKLPLNNVPEVETALAAYNIYSVPFNGAYLNSKTGHITLKGHKIDAETLIHFNGDYRLIISKNPINLSFSNFVYKKEQEAICFFDEVPNLDYKTAKLFLGSIFDENFEIIHEEWATKLQIDQAGISAETSMAIGGSRGLTEELGYFLNAYILVSNSKGEKIAYMRIDSSKNRKS